MPILKSLLMSAKHRNYNPINEDGYDTKIPPYNEEAFEHGLVFHIKFIGSLEISKPTSRAEIVAVMRRIRYEFKARSVKKRPVHLAISVNGIKVYSFVKNRKNVPTDDNQTMIMQYPIHRVFYVSHDSLDLKIFSFIVRDSETNTFRCHVFKEVKKNEAMHIVRTIGQAFEVCHKLSLQQKSTLTSSSQTTVMPTVVSLETSEVSVDPQVTSDNYVTSVEPVSTSLTEVENSPIVDDRCSKHQMQFLQEQIQQLKSESDLMIDQIKLMKDQLNIETNARIEAQNKNKQLLEGNGELLVHIQQLLFYIQELEMNSNQQKMSTSPARPTDLLLAPSLFSSLTVSASHGGISTVADLSSESPDSGKGNEISSESTSDPFLSTLHDQSWTSDHGTPTAKISHDHGYSLASSSCSSLTPSKPLESTQRTTQDFSSFTNLAFSQSPLRTNPM